MNRESKRIIHPLLKAFGAGLLLVMLESYASAGGGTDTEKAKVRLGIDNLETDFSILSGKNVGLITNAPGVDSQFNSTIDVLYKNVKLKALFAPEHGIRGAVTAGAAVGGETDVKTGLSLYSLYGTTYKPTDGRLEGID